MFEYIIFRGADIKVIDVVEPPKNASNSGMHGLPSDPAIVDFSVSYFIRDISRIVKNISMQAQFVIIFLCFDSPAF